MPMVRVTMVAGRSAEAKKAAADDITRALVEHCGARESHVYVVFEDVADTDWIVGTETVATRRKKLTESGAG